MIRASDLESETEDPVVGEPRDSDSVLHHPLASAEDAPLVRAVGTISKRNTRNNRETVEFRRREILGAATRRSDLGVPDCVTRERRRPASVRKPRSFLIGRLAGLGPSGGD